MKFQVFMAKVILLTAKSKTDFQSFFSDDMLLIDKPRLGWLSNLDQDALRKLVDCNLLKRIQELGLDLNTSQSTICCHLKKIRKVSNLGVWLPHTLSEKNKYDCILIVTSLLSRQRNFLRISKQVIKNWSFMTMFKTRGCGLTRMNFHNLLQAQSFMEE